MARYRQRPNVSLAVVWIAMWIVACILGMPARAAADDSDDVPTPPSRPWPWPRQLIVLGELRAIAELAWEHSPTFRAQCRKLAAAGATMIVEPATPRETMRAMTRIRKTENGVTLARARVRPGENAPELIAHELEHVLEFIEGLKFLMESRAGRSGVSLRAGAYETCRAVDAGRRVAQEVRDGRNSPLSSISSVSSVSSVSAEVAQNSTRNPNCH